VETARIERLVAGGDGLARMADGRVVFVVGGLPGELVEIAIQESKKDFARGVVQRIVEPSMHRVEAPCPHVARGCGGCSWQHLDPAQHLEAKVEIVREALRRTARMPDLDVRAGAVLPSAGSRTTLRMAVGDEGRLGFRRAQSHDVVAIDHCLVAHELLADIVADARVVGASEATVRCGVGSGERGVWLHDERGYDVKTATIDGLAPDVMVGRKTIVHERVHGVDLRVSMPTFFQSSPLAAELLVSAVDEAAGDDALSGEFGPIVDAYGGCGLFTATLIDLDVDVTLVESSRSACADAKVNLGDHRARIEEVAFEQWSPTRAGLVIADPARNGLGKRGVETLAATGAPRVVLVSCDAVAGARDIALLAERGYQCDSVTVLDLFPNTPHVEMVASLRLSAP
jgi:23S rRNA (uracil1939-C5)-methyltransferase